MNKFRILLLVLIISPLIAGIYGVLDSHLTFIISPEYFTKFKFVSAGIVPGVNDHWEISKIGFLATWWIGAYMGVGIGIVGLIHSSSRQMRKVTIQSMFIAVIVTFLTGMVGLGYGFVFLSAQPPDVFQDWFIPTDLEHYTCYVAVYSMHNFSFVGGALGLASATAWQFIKKERSVRK